MFKKKYDFDIPSRFRIDDKGPVIKDPVIGFHALYEYWKKEASENVCALMKTKKEAESLKEENAKLKGTESQLKKAKAELEHFYLNEIGRCETVDEVKKIWFRFSESEFGSSAIDDIVSLLPKTLGTGAYARNIKDAAITKIKRINKKNIMRMCQNLDNETNKMEYARIMMNELKETAEIEWEGHNG